MKIKLTFQTRYPVTSNFHYPNTMVTSLSSNKKQLIVSIPPNKTNQNSVNFPASIVKSSGLKVGTVVKPVATRLHSNSQTTGKVFAPTSNKDDAQNRAKVANATTETQQSKFGSVSLLKNVTLR